LHFRSATGRERIGYKEAASPVEIDEDVREECLIEILKMPE
jgi:hypothetical protein